MITLRIGAVHLFLFPIAHVKAHDFIRKSLSNF